jgi:GTP-binding protein
MHPQVIIIGRPNVGKSTLFNRLVGKKLALVDDQPGVTRDRRFGEATLLGLEFTIVDTAGWEDEDPSSLPGRMRQQTEASLTGADVALFVVDARAGITPLDEEIGRYLREHTLPVILWPTRPKGALAKRGCWKPIHWASAIPWAFRPNMARAWAICSKRSTR